VKRSTRGGERAHDMGREEEKIVGPGKPDLRWRVRGKRARKGKVTLACWEAGRKGKGAEIGGTIW